MMSSITKSIQNEYVLLMENAFSEKYKYAFRNLELKELRRFILKELIS
ncbi:putative coiled-coil protein, partial [Salmonella enterica subsp. enterica serovar Baildon str. R6-199]